MMNRLLRQTIALKVDLLEAYESVTPIPGAVMLAAGGNTLVRLKIENLTPDSLEVEITTIEIVPVDGDKPLMVEQSQRVKLGGLQILEEGFRLSNTEGFGDFSLVRAIVTCQTSGQSFVAESQPREVKRF